MFNEQNLRADIVDKWGPAGAHVDVFDELLRRYEELRAAVTAWVDAEEPLTIARGGFTEELNAYEAARDALLKAVGR